MTGTEDVRFAALGCGFRVVAHDPVVAGHLRTLFRHLGPSVGAGEEWRYEVSATDGGGLLITAEGAAIEGSIQALVRDIDEQVIARSPRLLVHASAAVLDGRAIAFPARTGSGKSTLVAGLVRAGLGYLTDEFVSPDWETGVVAPYPRFVSVRNGSWDVLGDLEPHVPARLTQATGTHWQVDPEDIRAGSIAGPSRLGLVVFPHYEEGAATVLREVPRAEALIELTECTFHFHRHGARALAVLGGVISECECFHLTFGDLASACAAVGDLLGVDVPTGAA